MADDLTPRAPATFAHYEAENPYALLVDLHDRAVGLDRGDVDGGLTVIAMAAAVVSWWSRWQPTLVHRSLLTGATVDQVVDATGRSVAEVYHEWRAWARSQVDLYERGVNRDRPRPAGVAPAEFARVEALLARAINGRDAPAAVTR